MTRTRHIGLAVLAAAAMALASGHDAACTVAAQNAPSPRTMALTFDDLPYVDAAPREIGALAKAQRATSSRGIPNPRRG